QRQAESESHQLEGVRQALEHDVERRPTLEEGVSEVEVRDVPDVVDELVRDGLVEPELVPEQRPLLRCRLERQERLRRVPHEPGDEEDHHGHEEDDDDAVSEPPEGEPSHSSSYLCT